MHAMPWWVWLAAGILLAHAVAAICFLARGPRWFARREDRRILDAAALEILDHRRSSGEISEAQYIALKKHPKSIH